MAARTRKIRHDANTRAKIQASQLINRLAAHVLGKVDMAPSQVTAGLGLLRKVMPDLAAVELSGEVKTAKVMKREPLKPNQWVERHNAEQGTEIRH